MTSLTAAGRVVVLTGAGISKESGLPTFRDAMTGLWAQYRAEDLATNAAFQRDPKLVWDWYAWRRSLVRSAKPNAGHVALVTMASRVPHFTVITQNVDGLHQLAGSTDVIELHGNIRRSRCSQEGTLFRTWTDEGDRVPSCSQCGALLRPDVIWFGENLPVDALDSAIRAVRQCDVFFSIGTSGIVQPAASLINVARESHALTVIVNTDMTSFRRTDCLVEGPAAVVLPAIVDAAWPDNDHN